ncbi:hypothetical protein GCM10009557_59720 [Virgisporangium ochraceum]|jgi:hypothetical protein|uniref:Uncharacterized protein n=1 Tax=Virgisporangium ochraceum TaxID=65505 RepID=A0A8J3ZVL6_9ACTN|nr:hypothetical protein [Virgisporangium ochraceum]GIJ70784.1 hypothetical protein Voc01_057010 [Virgisporangium ochraceum]
MSKLRRLVLIAFAIGAVAGGVAVTGSAVASDASVVALPDCNVNHGC